MRSNEPIGIEWQIYSESVHLTPSSTINHSISCINYQHLIRDFSQSCTQITNILSQVLCRIIPKTKNFELVILLKNQTRKTSKIKFNASIINNLLRFKKGKGESSKGTAIQHQKWIFRAWDNCADCKTMVQSNNLDCTCMPFVVLVPRKPIFGIFLSKSWI